ncbi:hypothetical protein [Kitasatospora sp. NPDC097691]|uniref:hypothetical protein n=1 Tax=Kitasatospora sp. NPDC097691 TaxID=3157231 RepID=UPI00332BDD93
MPEPDWPYLVDHGLDRATLELHFPLGADWHTLRACAHPACDRPADKHPWLCWQCCTAWRKAGAPGDVASWCAAAPAPPARRVYGEKRCAVGCTRPAEASGLCKSCASARKATGLSVEEYLATGPAPRPGLGECVVRVCSRWAVQKGRRLCLPHQRQWADAGRPDLTRWALTAPAVGCPVYYRCFSCKFFTTDFTQLPELRQLRDTKAEQLVRLEAAYGSLLVPGPLSRANMELLRQELVQIDELISKCETDLGSLTEEDKATVEAWLHSRDRFLTVIPVAAVLAGRQQLAQPTVDPILLTGEGGVTGGRSPQWQVSKGLAPERVAALDAGRQAAAARRRADSEACRQRVLDVIAGMRKTRKPVSDAEITRRAEVNPQYLQRHRDLKAEAEAVRAHLAGDRPRAAAAAAARQDAGLAVENRMLLEQNTALRRDLEAARAELRAIRVRDLAADVLGDLTSTPSRDAEVEALRGERDQALAAVRRADMELMALRNVVQRLMVENTRLLGHGHQPSGDN